MNRYRAVFLDVGWTLLYPSRSLWEMLSAVCGEMGAPVGVGEVEDLIHGLTVSHRAQELEQFERGRSYPDSDAEFLGQFEALGRLMCAARGLDVEPERFNRRLLELFWGRDTWALFPDVLDGIVRLRAWGLRVGVVSNAGSDLDGFLERLGIREHLDFTVISAVEGARKPDRRIFARALDLAGVGPAEAVHVGDMYFEDVRGARGAGVRALLMERAERSMFPNHPESATCPAEEIEVVRSLDDVIAAVADAEAAHARRGVRAEPPPQTRAPTRDPGCGAKH